MKKLISFLPVIGLLFGFSIESHANPAQPILLGLSQAKMDFIRGAVSFSKVSGAQLTLYREAGLTEESGPTHMQLEFTQLDRESKPHRRHVFLEVRDTDQDECGNVIYTAFLRQTDPNLPVRFSVHLTDYSANICDRVSFYNWKAEVREGFGFCGTMDSTMTLMGNPVEFND